MTSTTSQDKTITIDVPEERVPEFYAFYARFLAGRGRGPGRRGGGRGRHGHCHPHHEHRTEGQQAVSEATTPETTEA